MEALEPVQYASATGPTFAVQPNPRDILQKQPNERCTFESLDQEVNKTTLSVVAVVVNRLYRTKGRMVLLHKWRGTR